MTRPRLLMICERFPPDIGGLAQSAYRLSASMARLGIDVQVLAWTRMLPGGSMQSTTNEHGVTVHHLGLYASQDLSMQHTMNVLAWLHESLPMQAVWGHYLFPAGFMAVLFGRTVGIPSTVSARGNDVDRMVFPPGDFARLTWTLKNASQVTAVSRDLAQKIQALLEPSRAVTVLPNTVDAHVFAPGPQDTALRERLGIPSDERVLGFCGELRHKKGA